MRSVKPYALILIWGLGVVMHDCMADESPEVIRICTDNANWRPFVYQENGQIMGLHIDTISEALTAEGQLYEFIPAPWKRCLKGAERGSFDAIGTASYNTERAEYLWYPEDAVSSQSDWRIGQVEYHIIVHASSPYEFDVDMTKIPQPIRVPRDYSIGNDLRALDLPVDDSSIHDIQNLKRLVREKNGSVVALPSIAEWANEQEEFKGQIRLIPEALRSKSYFLAFSKRGKVNKNQINSIWERVRQVRDQGQTGTPEAQQNWH